MTSRIHLEGGHPWRSQGGRLHELPGALPNAPSADAAPLLRSQIVKKIQPHQNGARRLSTRFAERLVCVRYRTDPETGRRFTTVEILVEERAPTAPTANNRPTHQLIRIGWGEGDLRETIKAHGGTWVRDRKLWRVSTEVIRRLKLGKRVIPENA